ncbi:MAG: hypothetical protein HY332_17650 [Chloroflexi bacterium]|nr:hypothetical protein [Chloroflexota bacterium]
MPKYIEITEDEAWAIDHTIRHTYADGPNNVGKDLLLKVMTVILEFEERRGKPFSPQVLALALTEDECWAVDHQIRCDLTVNGKPIGRALLLKIFRALTEYVNERDSESGVEQLGTLADMLRPPAEEQLSNDTSRPESSGDAASGPSNSGAPDPHLPPDDGAAGPLPRGK